MTAKETRDFNQLRLEHGKPMRFGPNLEKGIILDGIKPRVVTLGENGVSEKDILVHDEKVQDPTLAYFLSRFHSPEFPTPLGVFRAVEETCYEDAAIEQMKQITGKYGPGDLDKLFSQGETWTVPEKT